MDLDKEETLSLFAAEHNLLILNCFKIKLVKKPYKSDNNSEKSRMTNKKYATYGRKKKKIRIIPKSTKISML